MYVRRKVFSVLSDETGEERLFSTNEVEYLGYDDYEIDDQREYSEFDDENEYQREFADSDDSRLKKAAKVLGVSVAALGAAVGGSKLAGKGVRKVASNIREKAIANQNFGGKAFEKNAKLVKVGKAFEKPYDYIAGGAKSGYNKVKNVFSKKK